MATSDIKTAIITGAGRGIGKAIAQAFLRESIAVAGVSRTPSELKYLEKEGGIRQIPTAAIRADVSQEADVLHVFDQAVSILGHVDILVNNAGTIVLPGDLLSTSFEAYETMMQVNAQSVFLCCKAVIPHMLKRCSGSIINISSIAGLRGLQNRAVYCATKHAVNGFTKALAIDLRPRGIAVNAICPGAVHTSLTDYSRPDAKKEDWMQPEDIADVAVFLASDRARAMTGSILEVVGWAD